jgi:hypothetical protein
MTTEEVEYVVLLTTKAGSVKVIARGMTFLQAKEAATEYVNTQVTEESVMEIARVVYRIRVRLERILTPE